MTLAMDMFSLPSSKHTEKTCCFFSAQEHILVPARGLFKIRVDSSHRLQRVISAYFNMPVTAGIVDNTQVP